MDARFEALTFTGRQTPQKGFDVVRTRLIIPIGMPQVRIYKIYKATEDTVFTTDVDTIDRESGFYEFYFF